MGPYKPLLLNWVDEFIPYYMEMSWELIDPIAHIGWTYGYVSITQDHDGSMGRHVRIFTYIIRNHLTIGSMELVYLPTFTIKINHTSVNINGENAGTLGMVPLRINPIYTLYSGYLLGISPFKGLLGGLNG